MPASGASLASVAALELALVLAGAVAAGAAGREQPASAAIATASAPAVPHLLLNMCMASYRPRAQFQDVLQSRRSLSISPERQIKTALDAKLRRRGSWSDPRHAVIAQPRG